MVTKKSVGRHLVTAKHDGVGMDGVGGSVQREGRRDSTSRELQER